jgi:adenylate kinase family enzyme
MQRVVVLGPGGSGKSALAAQIGEIAALPVIELDKIFWQEGLSPTPRDQWIATQQQLVQADRWIMDGDLGPYDIVETRLRASDTVAFLDFSIIRCAWRAFRRSRERPDFWLWLFGYRRQSRPFLMKEIARHAPNTTLYVLPNPAAVRQFIAKLTREYNCRKAPDQQ